MRRPERCTPYNANFLRRRHLLIGLSVAFKTRSRLYRNPSQQNKGRSLCLKPDPTTQARAGGRPNDGVPEERQCPSPHTVLWTKYVQELGDYQFLFCGWG